jgi:hypothetical protein
MTPENWNGIVIDTVHARGMASIGYIVPLCLIGHYVVELVFLAILLSNIPEDDVDIEEDDDSYHQGAKNIRAVARSFLSRVKEAARNYADAHSAHGNAITTQNGLGGGKAGKEGEEGAEKTEEERAEEEMNRQRLAALEEHHCTVVLDLAIENLLPHRSSKRKVNAILDAAGDFATITGLDKVVGLVEGATQGIVDEQKRIENQTAEAHEEGEDFPLPNWLEDFCAKVVANKIFITIMFLVVLLSCVTAVVSAGISVNEAPQESYRFLFASTWIITVFFSLEFLFKLGAKGWSYFTDMWDLLDLLLLFMTCVDLAQFYVATFSIKYLKGLRALRPIRLVSTINSMRSILTSIFQAFLACGNLIIFMAMVFYVYGVLGMTLLQGRFRKCYKLGDNPTKSNPTVLSDVNEAQCAGVGGVWHNPIDYGNFDNIGQAMLTLFELTTEENWPGNMYAGVDATPAGMAKVVDYNQAMAIYYVMGVIIGSFFIKNLFTGAVVDAYSSIHAHLRGDSKLSPLQLEWLDMYKQVSNNKPERRLRLLPGSIFSCKQMKAAETWVRKMMFKLVVSDAYDAVGQCVTLLNCVIFAIEYYDQPAGYARSLQITLDVCTWFFFSEVVLLIFTIGPWAYIKKGRNMLDFAIVIVSLLEFFNANMAGFRPSFFRIFRLLRLIRFARRTHLFGGLIKTLMFSLPALYSAFIIIFLLFFAFGVAATDFFGKVKAGYYIQDNYGNFRTTFNSIVLLIRMSTGENWNGIMRDCAVQPPHCDESTNCGSSFSYFFFPAFMIIMSFVLLSMMGAVIMAQFEEGKVERIVPNIQGDMFEDFASNWSVVNGEGDFIMNVSTLPTFLAKLPFELVPEVCLTDKTEMSKFIKQIDLPYVETNSVHYVDVIAQVCTFPGRFFFIRILFLSCSICNCCCILTAYASKII